MKKSHNDSTHGRWNVHEYFLYRETHYQNYHISFVYVKHAANYVISFESRTTDAQRGNSLHCTAENSLPLPNF